MKQCVIVPQEDIDRLEDERIHLHELIANLPIMNRVSFISITGAMWVLSHKRYPKEGIISRYLRFLSKWLL